MNKASSVKRFVPILFLVIALSGCLGESRTEWAYEVTQFDDVIKTGAGIRIGVLDTGIDVGHNSMDHLVDGNNDNGELVGFRDFISGVTGVENAYDDNGHGTHVVGIMGARGSSVGDRILYGGIDLKGASPEARFFVAKVCAEDGCPDSAISDGISWMQANNVDVISMSLGGEKFPITIGDRVRTAVNAAIDDGIVVVASAGNDGPNNEDVDEPADIEGVIAVGAIEKGEVIWRGSSRGSNDGNNACRGSIPAFGAQIGRCEPHMKPEIVAPGVEILSAWIDGSYVKATGTSQAAPFVASAVALMLQGKPQLQDREDVYAVKQALVDSAKQVASSEHDDAYGYGILQVNGAINAYKP
jgi:serine protease AprX